MSKNLLDDDFDWNQINEEANNPMDETDMQAVVMLRTFNMEEQAHFAAAALRNEGIDAHVVSATTSQLTPFAYGNVRLFVAQSQVDMAEKILKEFNARQKVYDEPHISAGRILVILIIGIFLMGLLIKLVQMLIENFQTPE